MHKPVKNVTLLLGINGEVGSIFHGLMSAFACNSYVKENLCWNNKESPI